MLVDHIAMKSCTGCMACMNACPKNCITMVSDIHGFWYPHINNSLCIECGKCEKSCPIITPPIIPEKQINLAYAAYSNKDEIRKGSSSGGIFYELAAYVIEHDGAVIGAATNERMQVEHIIVDTLEELPRLQASKYVQSRISRILEHTRKLLIEGKIVLFTGTPCQIAGLKSFLGKDYENLICQDIICHGVPSPLAWEKYLIMQEHRNGPVKSVNFRDKANGWRNYSFTIAFQNGDKYNSEPFNDPYMVLFLKNAILRPSCHDCNFKGIDRLSDYTLADYWGIENVHPEFDLKDEGSSLVIIHSEKAQKIFSEIENKITAVSTDLQKAVSYNSSAIKSSVPSVKREIILNELSANKFSRKYLRILNGNPCLNFIYRVLRKIKLI